MAKNFQAWVELGLRDNLTGQLSNVRKNAAMSAIRVSTAWKTNMAAVVVDYKKAMASIQSGQKLMQSGMMTMAKGVAVAAPLALAAKHAAKFETGMAEIATLTDKSVNEIITSFGPVVEATQTSFGKKQQDVIKALYDGFSAGVPQTKQAAKEYLDAVGQMAVGGKADLSVAADAMTTVMNAYKAQGITYAQVSDQMFTAVREGKTTLSELAQNIGQVAAPAAEAGVSFADLMSVTAGLTASIGKTPESMTAIRAVMTGLMKPAQATAKVFKRLGIEVNKESLQNKGLVGTFDDITSSINNYTKSENERLEILGELFPNVRADLGAKILAGAANEKVKKTIDAMAKSQGNARVAFEKMAGTTEQQYNVAMAEASVAWKNFGTTMLPIVRDLLKELTPVIKSTSSWIKANKDTVATLAKIIGITGGVIVALGAMKIAFGFSKIVWGLVRAVKALFLVFKANPLAIIIAGFVAWGSVIKTVYDNWNFLKESNWDDVGKAFKLMWEDILGTVRGVYNTIAKIMGWDEWKAPKTIGIETEVSQGKKSKELGTGTQPKQKSLPVGPVTKIDPRKDAPVSKTSNINTKVDLNININGNAPPKIGEDIKQKVKEVMDEVHKKSQMRSLAGAA